MEKETLPCVNIVPIVKVIVKDIAKIKFCFRASYKHAHTIQKCVHMHLIRTYFFNIQKWSISEMLQKNANFENINLEGISPKD